MEKVIEKTEKEIKKEDLMKPPKIDRKSTRLNSSHTRI